MDFPMQNCMISLENFSGTQIRKLLTYCHDMAYTVLDLQRLQEKITTVGMENIAARYLAPGELLCWGRFTADKRRREWLGGRIAAKYAAAGLLTRNGRIRPGSELAIVAAPNGRPHLDPELPGAFPPDISISHSSSLAAALAVSKGLCGIDIQKITDRTVKVRDRFCTADENAILASFFHGPAARQSTLLTMLWAAKEALRKAAGPGTLPGFLELKLTGIHSGLPDKNSTAWRFNFLWKAGNINGDRMTAKYGAAVTLVADYALALTVRNDTVD